MAHLTGTVRGTRVTEDGPAEAGHTYFGGANVLELNEMLAGLTGLVPVSRESG